MLSKIRNLLCLANSKALKTILITNYSTTFALSYSGKMSVIYKLTTGNAVRIILSHFKNDDSFLRI